MISFDKVIDFFVLVVVTSYLVDGGFSAFEFFGKYHYIYGVSHQQQIYMSYFWLTTDRSTEPWNLPRIDMLTVEALLSAVEESGKFSGVSLWEAIGKKEENKNMGYG